MEVLINAPERCQLTFARTRGRKGALSMDGKLYFATPGDPLLPLTQRADFDVDYTCMEGTCGTCAMVLRDGETEEMRPVRMCRAKLPAGKQASLMPWEVLRPDHPDAKEYFEKMQKKYAKPS